MEISGYQIPDDLLYTKEHEWAKPLGETVRVGITDYAAKTLNDIVYVTFPKQGDHIGQMASMGTVESIKAVSELYSPVSGRVLNLNTELLSHPELVNKSPYGEGWIMEMQAENLVAEREKLLDAKGYTAYLDSLMRKK